MLRLCLQALVFLIILGPPQLKHVYLLLYQAGLPMGISGILIAS